jgi:hypothetical protein
MAIRLSAGRRQIKFPANAAPLRQETKMLSPHEFATLMLLRDAPDPIDVDRADLEALLERQLVTLEQLAQGQQRPLITINGHSVLKAAARVR